MDALEALLTRQSALKLVEPAPPEEILKPALEAAARAPDHGKLRPWRFILIKGEARRRFGDVLAEALRARDPEAPELAVEREREKPLRAPLIVTVVAKVEPDHAKIPEIEQVLSAGTAAQNLLLALHAQGFGHFWRTGAPAYDANVKRALGLELHDHIVGFLYLGTPAATPGDDARPDPAEFVTVWGE